MESLSGFVSMFTRRSKPLPGRVPDSGGYVGLVGRIGPQLIHFYLQGGLFLLVPLDQGRVSGDL